MNFSPTNRILVVAPHPDDESIGCGGLLLKYGPQCDILVLADGRKGYHSRDTVDEETLVQTRAEELRQAASIAGVRQVFFLSIPDGTVRDNLHVVSAFDISNYDVLLTPNHAERHPDHCVVTNCFLKMRDQQNPKAALYEYEVWSPLAVPSHTLDITDVMESKLEMVSQHRSQTKYVDYRAMTQGLNQYRGAGFGVSFCEAYRMIPYRTRVQRLYDRLPSVIRSWIRKHRHRAAALRKE